MTDSDCQSFVVRLLGIHCFSGLNKITGNHSEGLKGYSTEQQVEFPINVGSLPFHFILCTDFTKLERKISRTGISSWGPKREWQEVWGFLHGPSCMGTISLFDHRVNKSIMAVARWQPWHTLSTAPKWPGFLSSRESPADSHPLIEWSDYWLQWGWEGSFVVTAHQSLCHAHLCGSPAENTQLPCPNHWRQPPPCPCWKW